MQSRIITLGCVLAIAGITACDEVPDDDDELGSFRGFVLGDELVAPSESPGGGGTWLGNGLQDPDVSGLDPAHGLVSSSGLRSDVGLLASGDVDVVRYVVECALLPGDSIHKNVDGDLVELEGRVGLAPQWKTGACDEDCQQWVTACLLARTNVTGQSVQLWISADHPSVGLGLSDEYPAHEATFYGNLFAEEPALYFCRGSEEAALMAAANGRTCAGTKPEDCGFTTFGTCLEPQRCLMVDGIHPVDCAEGDPEDGVRYHSLSTYLAVPEEW